ncbi:MAG: Flp family type IVb pilin [Pseudomonadota bacterium]|jgi:pilus assembly protein Flp/PilA|nr:Flp family type IVb pilin [Pseudomonadota bacterium]
MLLNIVMQAKQWLSLATAKEQEGQGLIEYALIILLIAIAVILVLTALGGEIGQVFTDIINGLTGATQVPAP